MNTNERLILEEFKRLLAEGKTDLSICQIEARVAANGTLINDIVCKECGSPLGFGNLCTNEECGLAYRDQEINPTETILIIDAFDKAQLRKHWSGPMGKAGKMTGSLGSLNIPRGIVSAVTSKWESITGRAPKSGQVSIDDVRKAADAGLLDNIGLPESGLSTLKDALKSGCPVCAGKKKLMLRDALVQHLNELKSEENELLELSGGEEMSKEKYLAQRRADPSLPYQPESPSALLYLNRSIADYARRMIRDIGSGKQEDDLIDCPKCTGETFTKFIEYRPEQRAKLQGIPGGNALPPKEQSRVGDLFFLNGHRTKADDIYRYGKQDPHTGKWRKGWFAERFDVPWNIFVDWLVYALRRATLKVKGQRVKLKVENAPLTKIAYIDEEGDPVPEYDDRGKTIKYGGENPYGDPHPLIGTGGVWEEPLSGVKVKGGGVTTRLKLKLTGYVGAAGDKAPYERNPLGDTNAKVQRNLLNILKSKTANDPSKAPSKYGKYFDLQPFPSSEHEKELEDVWERVGDEEFTGLERQFTYSNVERDRHILVTTEFQESLLGEIMGLPAKPVAYSGSPNIARLLEKYEQDMESWRRGMRTKKGLSTLGEHTYSVVAKKFGLHPKLVNRLLTKLYKKEIQIGGGSDAEAGTKTVRPETVRAIYVFNPSISDGAAAQLSQLREHSPELTRRDFKKGNKTKEQVDNEYSAYLNYVERWKDRGRPSLTSDEVKEVVRRWLQAKGVESRIETGTTHDIMTRYTGLGKSERASARSSKAAKTMQARMKEDERYIAKQKLADIKRRYKTTGPGSKSMREYWDEQMRALQNRMARYHYAKDESPDLEDVERAARRYLATVAGEPGVPMFPRYTCGDCGYEWYQGRGTMCISCGSRNTEPSVGEFEIGNFGIMKAAQAIDILGSLGPNDSNFMEVYNKTRKEFTESYLGSDAAEAICEELEHIKNDILIPTVRLGKPYTDDVNFNRIFTEAQALFESLVGFAIPSVRIAKVAPIIEDAPILDPGHGEFWLNIVGAINEDDMQEKYRWNPFVLQNVKSIQIMLRNINSFSPTAADILQKLVKASLEEGSESVVIDVGKVVELIHNRMISTKGDLSAEEWEYVDSIARAHGINPEALESIPLRPRTIPEPDRTENADI